jgi:hypothetical protein
MAAAVRRAARTVAAAALVLLLGGCTLLRGRGAETPEQARVRTEGEARIRAEVEARLAAEPAIGAGRVRVEVARTDVHLHGAVEGFGALRCALTTAGLVPGVTLVVDYLVLLPGPSEAVCLAPRVHPGVAAGRGVE